MSTSEPRNDPSGLNPDSPIRDWRGELSIVGPKQPIILPGSLEELGYCSIGMYYSGPEDDVKWRDGAWRLEDGSEIRHFRWPYSSAVALTPKHWKWAQVTLLSHEFYGTVPSTLVEHFTRLPQDGETIMPYMTECKVHILIHSARDVGWNSLGPDGTPLLLPLKEALTSPYDYHEFFGYSAKDNDTPGEWAFRFPHEVLRALVKTAPLRRTLLISYPDFVEWWRENFNSTGDGERARSDIPNLSVFDPSSVWTFQGAAFQGVRELAAQASLGRFSRLGHDQHRAYLYLNPAKGSRNTLTPCFQGDVPDGETATLDVLVEQLKALVPDVADAFLIGCLALYNLFQSKDGIAHISAWDIHKVEGLDKRSAAERRARELAIHKILTYWTRVTIRGALPFRDLKGKERQLVHEDSLFHYGGPSYEVAILPGLEKDAVGVTGARFFTVTDTAVTKAYRESFNMANTLGGWARLASLPRGKAGAVWAASMGLAAEVHLRRNLGGLDDRNGLRVTRKTLLDTFPPKAPFTLKELLESRNPGRARSYFSEAGAILTQSGVLAEFQEPVESLPRKGWAEEWLNGKVYIRLHEDIAEGLKGPAKTAEQGRLKAAEKTKRAERKDRERRAKKEKGKD